MHSALVVSCRHFTLEEVLGVGKVIDNKVPNPKGGGYGLHIDWEFPDAKDGEEPVIYGNQELVLLKRISKQRIGR